MHCRIHRQRRWWLGVVLLAAGHAQAALDFEGVNNNTQEVLRAFITVDDLPCDAPRWWVQRAHRRTADEARSALETLGYYQAEVETSLSWDDENAANGCWRVAVNVTLNRQVRVSELRLDIPQALARQPRMADVLQDLEIAPETRFTHAKYERTKSQLLQQAQSLGYFDADYRVHQVRVDPVANVAEIELDLEAGERYRIGEISTDQRILRDELFARYLRVEPGAYYDDADLTESYRALLESEYFDRVLVTPDLDLREDGQVPLRIQATASTRRSFALGAGYATDTGPRLRGDLRYRRVNDRGHRANLSVVASAVDTEMHGQYRLPYGDPLHDWYFVETEIRYQDTDTFRSLKRRLGVGRTLQRFGVLAETNYADYLIESFDVGEQSGRSELLLLGTRWVYSTAPETPRPTSGTALGLDIRGGARALASDNDVLQMIVRGRQILPLGDRIRVLGRAQAGWTIQRDFEALPPSIRFFAGGDNSVRGYGFESLGPEENGEVVGGKRLLTGSVEFDVLFRQNWSAAVFADIGSAFDTTPDFSRGVGFGVRWYSPLGPLRVDLAHPLDDPGRAVRVHISLGPDL